MIGFWKRFNAQAAELNISKKEAAATIGIKYSSFCNYQSSNRIPKTELAIKLAKLLGVSVEWLVTGEREGDSITPQQLKQVAMAAVKTYSGIDASDPVLLEVAKNPDLHKLAAYYFNAGKTRIKAAAIALGLTDADE